MKKEGKVPETILITSKAEILQMLVDNGDITQDDLSLISKGGSVDVVLVVKDATDTVTEEAKNAMTNVATKSGYTIGQYIDISLYKIVNGMTEDAEQIHNTTGKVKIAVQIPENLINKDNSKKREYAMIRNHEGTAEILDGTYDANAKTFTFETDKFSDYAIAYKDTVKSSGAGTKINPAAKPAKGQPKATKDQKKSGNAKTGDTNNLVLWTLTVVLAVLVATLIMELRRRKRY